MYIKAYQRPENPGQTIEIGRSSATIMSSCINGGKELMDIWKQRRNNEATNANKMPFKNHHTLEKIYLKKRPCDETIT